MKLYDVIVHSITRDKLITADMRGLGNWERG